MSSGTPTHRNGGISGKRATPRREPAPGRLHGSHGGGMFFNRLRAETRKGWFRLPRDGRRGPGLASGGSRRARMFDFIAAGGMRSLGGRPIEESIARRRAGMLAFCFLLGILWVVFHRIPPPA